MISILKFRTPVVDSLNLRLASWTGLHLKLLIVVMMALNFACSSGDRAKPKSASTSQAVRDEEQSKHNIVRLAAHAVPCPIAPKVTKSWETPELTSQSIQLLAAWGTMSGPDIELLRHSNIYGHHVEGLEAEIREASYSEETFANFLWKDKIKVGEPWKLEEFKAIPVLEQLHHVPLTNLNMDASGAYAVLRAASSDYFQILFRLHAQFCIADYIYLTPAQFDGTLLIDRRTGKVELFELLVPNNHRKNLAFEVHEHDGLTGLGQIKGMRIGTESPLLSPKWEEKISDEEARELLANEFFTCRNISWLPLDKAVKKSQETKKPLFLLAIAGVLDDQSC